MGGPANRVEIHVHVRKSEHGTIGAMSAATTQLLRPRAGGKVRDQQVVGRRHFPPCEKYSLHSAHDTRPASWQDRIISQRGRVGDTCWMTRRMAGIDRAKRRFSSNGMQMYHINSCNAPGTDDSHNVATSPAQHFDTIQASAAPVRRRPNRQARVCRVCAVRQA